MASVVSGKSSTGRETIDEISFSREEFSRLNFAEQIITSSLGYQEGNQTQKVLQVLGKLADLKEAKISLNEKTATITFGTKYSIIVNPVDLYSEALFGTDAPPGSKERIAVLNLRTKLELSTKNANDNNSRFEPSKR